MNIALTRPRLIQIAIMAALFAVFFLRGLPLELDPVRTANASGQFDATGAIARLARVIGDKQPHPVDSDALDDVRERLLTEIRALGYEPEARDETACRGNANGAFVRCARVRNVLFTAAPREAPSIVLTAHYDSVDISPGAGDDGIGVAVILEAARLFKAQPPRLPVTFLITDGEETNLLGAQAFADNKLYGMNIARVINLEARGVRGPAMMFETSHPNERVVSDWAMNADRPVANSLMTAVYELLPNSTDFTVHLASGLAGVNMAIGDGLAFYHSERDDLSMLDPRSVQHMGDQALAAAGRFLMLDPATREGGEIVYADLASVEFVSMPLVVGLMILGLCFGLSALNMMRPARDMDWKRPDWRAFLVPPLLMLVSGVLAYVFGMLIGMIRPEPDYWWAWRQPLVCLVFLLSLLAAVAGLALIAKTSRKEALFAAGWFWFLAIGTALSFVVPGASILFVIPGVWFVIAGVTARFRPRWATAMHWVAAIVLWFVFVPLVHLFDVMMGLGMPALFGILSFLLLAPVLALIGPIPDNRILPLGAAGAAALAALIVTLAAPAHTVDAPLNLNIVAHYDMDERKALAVAAAAPGSVPAVIAAQLGKTPERIVPGFNVAALNKPIAFADRPSATATVTSDTTTAEARTLQLRLTAPGARFIRLRIPAGAKPLDVAYQPVGRAIPTTSTNGVVFDCVGRSCDGAVVTVRLATGTAPPDPAPAWDLQAFYSGLPEEAAAIAKLRPPETVQVGTGDITITTSRLRF